MVDYEKLYHIMVDSSEKVIEQIERQNFGTAAELLKRGEQDAEELYIKLSEAEGIDYQRLSLMLLDEIKDVLEFMRNGKFPEAEGVLLAVMHCAQDDIEESETQAQT